MAKYNINYGEFCTDVFAHILHNFASASLKTFDKLSKNYFIKNIEIQTKKRCRNFFYIKYIQYCVMHWRVTRKN